MTLPHTVDANMQQAAKRADTVHPWFLRAWCRARATPGAAGLLATGAVLVLGLYLLPFVLRPDPRAAVTNVEHASAVTEVAAEAMTEGSAMDSQRVPIRTRKAVSDPLDERAASGPHPHKTRGSRPEVELQAELRALARSDPEAFDRRFDMLVAGTMPASEQYASLRVAYEEQRPASVDRFACTVATLSQGSRPEAESVPQGLVKFLAQEAAREPRARETLAALVWGESPCAETTLRVRALRELVLASKEDDVALLARRIHATSDPVLHSAGVAVLDERIRPASPPDPIQEFP